jgi:hypothetical protein
MLFSPHAHCRRLTTLTQALLNRLRSQLVQQVGVRQGFATLPVQRDIASPLMGAGSGGGEDGAPALHPSLPPPRGKGYTALLGLLCDYLWVKFSPSGEGEGGGSRV